MKRIDLYLAQPISIMGANGTSYENVTHIDTTKEGGEYIEDKDGEILFFNEMDAEMQLNAQQAMFDEKDEQEHGKQIELDYDAGDTVTWHCDDDGQDHTSTITGISIEVNSEGEAEVTYKTEIEFKGRKQDAYFSEYDIVNK